MVRLKTGVGAFTTAVIRLCGKRVDGRASHLVNGNDHAGYDRFVEPVDPDARHDAPDDVSVDTDDDEAEMDANI